MLGVKDLAKHYALSERAVHRRLTLIGAIALPGVELTGKGYRVSDEGLAIFGRVLAVERDGHTIEEAASVVQAEVEEMKEPVANRHHDAASEAPESAAERRAGDEPAAAYVEHLEGEIEFLRQRIVTLEERLPALPAPGDERPGRLAALRYALLGR